MKEKLSNKKYLLTVILFIIIVSLVGTFAWLRYRSRESSLVLTIGEKDGVRITIHPYQLNTSLIPIQDYDDSLEYSTIKVDNNSNKNMNFNIYYDIEEIDDNMDTDNLMYTILKKENNIYNEVEEDNFSNISDDKLVIYESSIPANTEEEYKVYTWLQSIDGNQSEQATFKANLSAEIVSNELYEIIKKKADKTTQIDFSKTNVQDGTNGVYTFTESGSNPVYYFRGDNTLNNNVIFADYCWQIVRTTETGGVKMIYNGEPTNGECTETDGTKRQIGTSKFNTSSNDKKYVGYYYDNNATKSTIATYIDNWYSTTGAMTGYISYLEDTPYCNDRSGEYASGSFTYFAPYDRLSNSSSSSYMKPTLKCNTGDSFKVSNSVAEGKLQYPVGLLTVDEAMLGGLTTSSNSNNYLKTGSQYWLSAPYHFNSNYALECVVDSSGSLSYNRVSNVYNAGGARPVVSLKPGLEIEDGTEGTKGNPYRIKEKHYLYDIIKNNANTTTQIDFTKTNVEDGTNGVYTFTESGSSPVYYFRGDNTLNNNVLFANHCWQIVRTTETGGVKMIYNGSPTNGQCTNTSGTSRQIGTTEFNTSSDDKKYVGYYYDNNSTPSTIAAYIDNWYSTTGAMTGYTSYLEDTPYCNDRSGEYVSRFYTYFAPYDRVLNSSSSSYRKPTLKCNTGDSFKVSNSVVEGKLQYPIGLLTADEAMLGGLTTSENSNNYLVTGSYYWLSAPYNMDIDFAFGYNVYSSGSLSSSGVHVTNGARPVVSLKPGLEIEDGTEGTKGNPYRIKSET